MKLLLLGTFAGECGMSIILSGYNEFHSNDAAPPSADHKRKFADLS